MNEMTERDHRDVMALADGSLSRRRRSLVEARVAGSPVLSAALARQVRAVGALRGIDVAATPALRARIKAARGQRTRGLRPSALRLGLAASAAAVVVALITALPMGGAEPTVPEVARTAGLRPTGPAPEPRRDEPALLDVKSADLFYPNWDDGELGWRAAGQRSDDVDGRSTDTVFYENDGGRLAYAIVSGEAIEPPADARRATRDGVKLSSFRDDGRLVVTWLREGHTCVLSGTDTDRDTMLTLAAWKGDGAVTF